MGQYSSLRLAVESIAPKIGRVVETLLTWVKRQDERQLRDCQNL
jgi:hypothetical protein